MMQTMDQVSPTGASPRQRRLVRYAAAALSALCAIVYVLIGFGLIYPLDEGSAETPGLLFFGVSAGLAFALGAFLLVTTDRRPVWILGAIFQVVVVWAYVSVADKRDPPYEPWGIALKIAQVAILAALAYLIATTRTGQPDGATGGDRSSVKTPI